MHIVFSFGCAVKILRHQMCLLIRHLHTFIIEYFLGHDLQTSFYFMKSHQNQNAFLRKEVLYSTLVNCTLQSGVVTFK